MTRTQPLANIISHWSPQDLSLAEGFALALFPRYPNLGLPLWHHPKNWLGLAPRIGDVGCILGDGIFTPITNTTGKLDAYDPESVPMGISADDIVESTHRFESEELTGFFEEQRHLQTTRYTALLNMDAGSEITTKTLTGECQFRLLINTLKNHNNWYDWAYTNILAGVKERDLFVVCGCATAKKNQVEKRVESDGGPYDVKTRGSGTDEELITLFLTGLKLRRRIDRPSAGRFDSLSVICTGKTHDNRMLRDPLDTILALILKAEPLAKTVVATHAYLAGIEEGLVSADKKKGSLQDALTSKMPGTVCLETGDSYWGTIALYKGQWEAFGSPSSEQVQEALRNTL